MGSTPDTPRPHRPPLPPAPATPRATQIYFVDDDELMAVLTRIMLEKFGYRVTLFADATDALRSFRRDPDYPAAIVSDYALPAMTGADLAREVFALRPDKPFLLLSGDLDAPGLRDGRIRHVLAKPFAMESLRAALDALLHPREPEPTAAPPTA